ncbi:hypothetical protein AX774_g5513 [Zancudomyces culisetae]|uniref:Uncharacterized protein n=1 Tax=Zancudomyces culisetae TaxID=1213189 RepID=A0A1R1PJB8_ZANCU|nr:hypothetical protein AX774_g5513 [Zancudomyces culisetae]|eukprot:OMH81038.1 hypothetical protein AX774_g5513 [Zancudomyces culisetae]
MEARVRQLEEILAAKSIEKENIDDLATYISDGNTFDGFYNTEIFPPVSEAISSQLNQSSPAFSVNFSHQTGLLNRRKPLLSEKFKSTLQKKFVDSFLELKAEIDSFYEGNILELQTIKHDNQSVCTSAAGYKNNCVQYVNPKASELSLMSEGFRSTTDMDTDESNSNNNTYSTFGSTLASSGPPVNHCIKCEYYLCSIKSLLIDNDFYREDNEKLKRRLENAIEDHNKLVDIFEDGKKLLIDPGIHSVVMS